MTDLVLMRHAKSAYPEGVPDVLRPLNDRGRRNAASAADVLARLGIKTALISVSVRTRETWAIVSEKVNATVHYLDELYAADANTINAAVTRWSLGPTLVLAHNPGIHECALRLATHAADARVRSTMAQRFPTSAIAHIRDGELLDFIIPR